MYWYWEIFHGNSPKKKASEYSKLSFFFYQTSINFFQNLKKQNNTYILTVQCLLVGVMVAVLRSFLAITNTVTTVGDHWPAVVLSTGVYTFNLYLIIMLAKNGFLGSH